MMKLITSATEHVTLIFLLVGLLTDITSLDMLLSISTNTLFSCFVLKEWMSEHTRLLVRIRTKGFVKNRGGKDLQLYLVLHQHVLSHN